MLQSQASTAPHNDLQCRKRIDVAMRVAIAMSKAVVCGHVFPVGAGNVWNDLRGRFSWRVIISSFCVVAHSLFR